MHPQSTDREGRATGKPVLEGVEGSTAGRSFELASRQLVVGKGQGADIPLADTGVSRQHAKVVVAADQSITVFDLASTNGTFVNGTRVELAKVRAGDLIRFGPTALLRLEYTPGSEASAPPPKATGALAELSERQLQVARLAAAGKTNAAIGAGLEISPRTVKSHLDQIYNRLGISSRTTLALMLAEAGLLR